MTEAGQEASRRIAVIGAGIVGVASALALQRDGHDVVLIDPREPGEATSYGNAGILGSSSMVPVTGPGLRRKAIPMLADRASPLFMRWSYLPRLMPWLMKYMSHCSPGETRRIAAALAPIVGDSLNEHLALAGDTPAARWITPCDLLYLYPNRAAFEGDSFTWDIRRHHGFDWQILESEALASYDPAFGRPDFASGPTLALRLGDHAHIKDPGRYVKDLAAHFVAQGGALHKATVRGFALRDGKLVGLESDTGLIPCGRAVLAGGAWSGRLTDELGIKVPLETERGYHIELHAPNVMPRVPLMIAAQKFIVTPMEGRIRCAGLVEFGGLEAGPSAAPIKLLLETFKRVYPDLTWSHVTEWMGHRPAPSDSIPVIGALVRRPEVFMAFGHHHIGLTGSARTGRMIADLIAGRRSNIDLAPYSPERFAS